MIKRLLGSGAMAALAAATVLAAVPASAARLEGCSGSNMMKTETATEAMADGDAKWLAFKEIANAQTAMLEGKMGACATHLTRAMHASAMK